MFRENLFAISHLRIFCKSIFRLNKIEWCSHRYHVAHIWDYTSPTHTTVVVYFHKMTDRRKWKFDLINTLPQMSYFLLFNSFVSRRLDLITLKKVALFLCLDGQSSEISSYFYWDLCFLLFLLAFLLFRLEKYVGTIPWYGHSGDWGRPRGRVCTSQRYAFSNSKVIATQHLVATFPVLIAHAIFLHAPSKKLE